MKRQSAVSGTFYHHDAAALEAEFQYFDDVAAKHFPHLHTMPIPRALIVPHAGYMYSGFTASCAYRSVPYGHYDRVVVLGPSHRIYLKGVSGCLFEGYDTPFGMLPFNEKTYVLLQEQKLINAHKEAHQEHSTEVQFPFIYRYFKALPTLELVYGENTHEHLCAVVRMILTDPRCLLIVSTDLSHFYKQEEAHERDKACIEAIESLHVRGLDAHGCEACGKAGVKALLDAASSLGWSVQGLDYRTSGDITGDKSRVVGYYSALIVDSA